MSIGALGGRWTMTSVGISKREWCVGGSSDAYLLRMDGVQVGNSKFKGGPERKERPGNLP